MNKKKTASSDSQLEGKFLDDCVPGQLYHWREPPRSDYAKQATAYNLYLYAGKSKNNEYEVRKWHLVTAEGDVISLTMLDTGIREPWWYEINDEKVL
jgi:hypothetical protein